MKIVTALCTILTLFVAVAPAQEGRQKSAGETEIIAGIVFEPDAPLATMIVGEEQIVLHLGPLWFWEENDYFLTKGEEIKVEGEVEIVDGLRHVYPNKLVMKNRSIELATESGIPLWARGAGGRSRGAGHDTDSEQGGPRGHGHGRGPGAGDDWRR